MHSVAFNKVGELVDVSRCFAPPCMRWISCPAPYCALATPMRLQEPYLSGVGESYITRHYKAAA